MTDKHKKLVSLLALILFALFILLLFRFVGVPMIRFIEDPAQYRTWIEGKGIIAELSFVAMFFFQVIVAIIPGEPLEICAGYTFGALEGTLLCMLGIALGSCSIFLLVRKLGVKLVEVFFSAQKIRSMRFLQDSRKRNMLTFIIMFIPGTPKDLISYFVGLTDMKLSEWLIISTIARIPSIVTSTVGGSALADKNYTFAATVFVIAAAISIAGIIIYNKIQTKRLRK